MASAAPGDAGHAGESAPTQVFSGVAGGNVLQIANVAGNVTAGRDRPDYWLKELAGPARRLNPAQARAQPSRLLRADYEVVPFAGRAAVLGQLAEWLAEPGTVSVRLLHGPGGQGKSRLGSFFARSQAGRWAAWEAFQDRRPGTGASLGALHGRAGALVVVDYADRWVTSQLRGLIADLSEAADLSPDVPAVRLLLLARSAGSWWESLEYHLDGEYDIAAEAMTLPPLGEDVDRPELFAAARDSFAAALDIAGADAPPPPGLGQPRFSQVLTVHMAALAAVDAHHRGEAPPDEPQRISAYLMRRERSHWHDRHTRPADPMITSPAVMGRAVYVATLTGPLPRAEAIRALLAAEVAAQPETAAQILDDHRQWYPPARPGTVLEPLYPDRLGEDFLGLTTPAADGPVADGADDWAVPVIGRLLAPDPAGGAAPPWARAAMGTVIETAARWPHIARGYLYPLLAAQPQLALQGGGQALAALAALADVEIPVLEAVENYLPERRHTDLDIGIAALARRLADHRLALTSDPEERAVIYSGLTPRLLNAGLPEQALRAADDAVAVTRVLVEANPDGLGEEYGQAMLAAVQCDLSAALSYVGRYADARGVAEEAVAVARRVAADDPEWLSLLAQSLTNLGFSLSYLGERAAALAATREAADIYRRQRADDAAPADEPLLAMALLNLGKMSADLGLHGEALAANQQAAEIYQRLAAADPTAFQPDLARVLGNQSAWLMQLGRHREALAASAEAGDIYRRLATSNRAAFEPDLARVLNNHGLSLLNLGRHDEALAASAEAGDI